MRSTDLYLSVGVSDTGGVEVESERGGRGGFSSSPSKHAKNESHHVTKRVCWECVGLSLIYTWIVPLICDSCFFSVDSIEQGGDQTLIGLQVQWHQLWEFFKPLWLHTLRCLGKRSRAIFGIKFLSYYKEQCLFIHDGGYLSLSYCLFSHSLPPPLLFRSEFPVNQHVLARYLSIQTNDFNVWHICSTLPSLLPPLPYLPSSHRQPKAGHHPLWAWLCSRFQKGVFPATIAWLLYN